MDRIILGYNNVEMGGGLRLCESLGVAFQDDMTRSVEYGEAYFKKYEAYLTEKRYGDVEQERARQVHKVVCRQATRKRVFDVGVGCGAFLNHIDQLSRGVYLNEWWDAELFGWDINPAAQAWLAKRGCLVDPYANVLEGDPFCWTMWDVLEHLRNPHELLDRIRVGDSLIVSLPIYDDLQREVIGSRHYRPDEHYYYFTKWGFVKWIQEYGMSVVEYNEDETLPTCGRQGIGTFIVRKVR